VKLDQASSGRAGPRGGCPCFGWKHGNPLRCVIRSPPRRGRRPARARQLARGRDTLAADGTFDLNGVPGFNRLVDSGDFGDTYNYSPPEHDLVVDAPVWTTLSLIESGPVRATAVVERMYRWPETIDEADGPGLESGRSSSVPLSTPGRRVNRPGHDELRQRLPDHRLRAFFPLPEPATTQVRSVLSLWWSEASSPKAARRAGTCDLSVPRFVSAAG